MRKHCPVTLRRRSVLSGIASSTMGAALMRPLLARAEGGAPKRLLIIHRPCGTLQSQFWPKGGTVTDFQLGPILSPFEKLKGDMVVLNDIENAVLESWGGDSHARGTISLLTCRMFQKLPGFGVKDGAADSIYIVGNARSVDQVLAETSPILRGTAKPSIQLGASRDLSSSAGLPGQRVLSYSGPGATGALFPETRPDFALMNIFGSFMPPTATPRDPTALLRLRAQNKGVLDLIAKDLGSLKAQVPASQRARLDEHLLAINDLTRQIDLLGAGGGGASQGCAKPVLTPLAPMKAGGSDDALHEPIARQMFQLIKTAFQCDVTRVATMMFAQSISQVQFNKIIPGFTNSNGCSSFRRHGIG